MPTYNFRHLEQVEEKLQEFGQINEANSIHPQTLADLLGSLLQEVDNQFRYLINEGDGNEIMVYSHIGASLAEHLNTIYDKLALFDSVIESLKQSGILPERVTVIVPLNQGYYDADNKDIHWYAANGKIVLRQWKANSTTNVSSSYVAAPRMYKEHIMHFAAMEGYKLLGVSINYSGQYKGDSLIAGTELDETGANVIDDEVAIARQWGTANDGEHILSVRSLDGVSDIYLQNVAATVVQLRITSISVIYKNII